ncbi:uncharacterized protein LOC120349620 [Nilaparvata lugens]|uniref:uncharacterized protein LOC120349620 n=1 Tax=Nilaparvata lugens TaxID=108931 RepID=UPI00193C8B73|nr:uncharacterized protein LOC120349620 [Nilaparvata lugens]
MTKSYQPKLNICNDRNGNALTEEDKVLDRWAEYFEIALNEQQRNEDEENRTFLGPEINVEEPTHDEVKSVIGRLNNSRAPGNNQIIAELIKHGGKGLSRELHELICQVWKEEVMTGDWNVGIIVPIYIRKETRRSAATTEP